MKLKNMHLVLAIPCFNSMDESLSLKSLGRLDVYLTILKGELYCLGAWGMLSKLFFPCFCFKFSKFCIQKKII